MPCKKPFALALLLAGTVACNTNLAIATFAANTKQFSELLPRVAAVRFNACVELAVYDQLQSDGPTLPKRDVAVLSCREQAQTRDRLIKEFSVLTQYFTALGQLANHDHAGAVASAQEAAGTAGSLVGANPAISGLAGALARAVLNTKTASALREAIESTDPHIQAYSREFQGVIAPVFSAALKDQERELTALYSDGVRATPANRLLLYRQFDSDRRTIREAHQLVESYSALMAGIAAAHARLYANRASLGSKETIAGILHDAAGIGGQIAAIKAAH